MTVRHIRNVPRYAMAPGAVAEVRALVDARRPAGGGVVFLIDEFFGGPRQAATLALLGAAPGDAVRIVSTAHEPSTDGVDALMAGLRADGHAHPAAVVGMGGGTTLDTAKAVANLYTNPGSAEQYQGWDLVTQPGVYKIGIPTVSGTGAESSRTCVMTNYRTGLKLGMNSDYTIFDHLVLDPDLTATVPRDQYFYTGMDAYLHCVESLEGRYRNPIGDALSEQVLRLCRQVFLEGDMQAPANRARLMTASYLGGCALASSFVGVVHPVSSGLSVVLGTHHCVANCITMLTLEEFYPAAHREFVAMAAAQGVTMPAGLCGRATDAQIAAMADAALLHDKPLANALGDGFRTHLTHARLAALYRRM